MNHSEEILGKEKIWKLCLIMGIPSVLAQLVNLLYNIVDRIYIGNINLIGKDALAGLGLCSPIIILISAFSSFVAGGGAPLAARMLGKKDKNQAELVLGNGVFLLVCFSIILSIVTYIFKRPLLYLIGASDNTFIYANDYLSIYLIGTLFVQLGIGLNTFISAQGKSKLAMASTLIGAILNILLDPLFIFKFKMNIKGAALATIISQFASMIFVLIVLCSKKTSLRIKIKNLRPNKKILLSIFGLGLASFVMASTESLIGFVLNGQLKKYGGDIHVSSLAILQSVMMLISVPISGFTQGVTPIISYNFGAKNINRFKKSYFASLLICFTYCSLSALVMILCPSIFGRMFTKDEELLLIVTKYLPIFVSGMLIFGIQRACQTTFVAIGEAITSLFIALLRKVILLIPFAYIFPKFLDVSGIYYAECVADFLAATCCGIIFCLRFKAINRKMQVN